MPRQEGNLIGFVAEGFFGFLIIVQGDNEESGRYGDRPRTRRIFACRRVRNGIAAGCKGRNRKAETCNRKYGGETGSASEGPEAVRMAKGNHVKTARLMTFGLNLTAIS